MLCRTKIAMALIQLTYLIMAATLFKISEAKCYGRNTPGSNTGCVTRAYLPVVLTDQYDIPTRNPTCTKVPDQSPAHTVLTNDDLNALLLLAKLLENDKTSCATKGIDVDRLLETLVTALVQTTTHTVETSVNRCKCCNTPVQNDDHSHGLLGLVDKLLGLVLGRQSSSTVVQGTTTTVAQGNGKGLVELDVGKKGLLDLNVGDLVDVNVGGEGRKGSVSHVVQGTTSTDAQGGYNDKGLVELDVGKKGLLDLNVGDLADVNIGGKETGASETSTKTSSTTTKTVESVLGNGKTQSNGDEDLLGGVTGKDGLLSGVLQSVG